MEVNNKVKKKTVATRTIFGINTVISFPLRENKKTIKNRIEQIIAVNTPPLENVTIALYPISPSKTRSIPLISRSFIKNNLEKSMITPKPKTVAT